MFLKKFTQVLLLSQCPDPSAVSAEMRMEFNEEALKTEAITAEEYLWLETENKFAILKSPTEVSRICDARLGTVPSVPSHEME